MASLLFIDDSFVSDYSEVERLGTHEPRTVDSLIRKQIQQVGGFGHYFSNISGVK